jgi:serine/threonine protein kinase
MAKTSWLYRPGDKIQNFTVVSRLGAGGMGQVYLCQDEALSRKVALKILPKSDGEDSEQDIRRFVQEGRLLAQIHHPNISTVHSIGEDDQSAFLVMEYIKGDMLHRLIRDASLNLHEKIRMLQGVALGLHEAHKRGIVHRDIKPANILINESGQAKLIDFGIAKAMFSKNEVTTETGAVIGTMNYIAPEIFSGSFPSIKSDVYSLGLVFFEMVTGLLPFDGPSRLTVLENIRLRNLKYPSEFEPLLPPAILRLILEATDPLPEKRTPSAKDFYARLEGIRLNHIPDKYLLPLRDLKIKNRIEVLAQLEKSSLPRALWPFALSKSVYVDPTPSNLGAQLETVKLENSDIVLSQEVIEKSIASVLELCAKQRAMDRPLAPKPIAPKTKKVGSQQFGKR